MYGLHKFTKYKMKDVSIEHIAFNNGGWMLNFEFHMSKSSKLSCQKKPRRYAKYFQVGFRDVYIEVVCVITNQWLTLVSQRSLTHLSNQLN